MMSDQITQYAFSVLYFLYCRGKKNIYVIVNQNNYKPVAGEIGCCFHIT